MVSLQMGLEWRSSGVAGLHGDKARALLSGAHSHAKPVSTFAECNSPSRFSLKKRAMTAPSFMDLALKAAENAAKAGEVPIGCVIVLNGEVIASAGNRTITDHDPTAHAEILAIRQAAERIGSERLIDCDLYATLEPCTMCAAAISFARIRRLYYGAADPKGGGVDSGVRFFASPTCHHAPEVYSAVGERESAALLREFFEARR
jgi:tRNA(adenine34) deaminase